MTALARLADTSPDLARMPEHVLRTVALTPGAYYDQRAADAAVAFFANYLRHSEGKFWNRRFILSPWQEFDIIRPLFGWKRPDKTRLFRACDVWVARKNGKTQLAAGIGLLIMAGDNEPSGEVYSIATNEEQATLVFKKGKAMLAQSQELLERLEYFAAKIRRKDIGGEWIPLTAKPRGKHGLNAHLIIGDELHEWKNDELYTFVRQSMGTRRQPLEFHTSTAGQMIGYGYERAKQDLAYLDGTLDADPERLIAYYAAGADDDWNDESVWAKANPNLGVSVSIDFLRSEYRKAKENPAKENDFRRYFLNQWTAQATRWLQPDKWRECCDPEKPNNWQIMLAECRGRPCYIGIDLASKQDIAAVIYVFPPAGGDLRTRIACRLYVPADNVEQRTKRDGVPYDRWVRDGALIATEGNTIDYERIFADILEDTLQLIVVKLGADKWNFGWIGPKLVAHFDGDALNKEERRVVEVQQGYSSMSPGAKELERLVLSAMLDHGGHPVLRWMAGNVAITSGQQGDIIPIKAKSAEKIDGIVAAIIALTLMVADAVPDPGLTIYEPGHADFRGFLTL